MPSTSDFRIAVLAGDGIGTEVTPAGLAALEAAAARVGGFGLAFEPLAAGAETYRATGNALPEATLRGCERADAILLGAMGLPSVRYPDGTEIIPQVDLRFHFGLYAGVRPIRAIPGVPAALADLRAAGIDFVLIRESTEGLFAPDAKGSVEDDRVGREHLVITRAVSERLFRVAFDIAERRKADGHRGRVTCVDKANIFPAFAFFRKIFDEEAGRRPGILADHAYVDAMALSLIVRPWDFDVLVTENMFGDILSDLAAGLIGGMGFAPSADIGETHAVFQPSHGSAPDIAGQGVANPTAMILSAAMMLDWLGERHAVEPARESARLIEQAVDTAFGEGEIVTCELGGDDGTDAVVSAVLDAIRTIPPVLA